MGAQGSRGRGGLHLPLWVCCLPFPSHPLPLQKLRSCTRRVLTITYSICVALLVVGHRHLCSRLLQDQVSCWHSGQLGAASVGTGSLLHHAWPGLPLALPLCPLGASAAGVGPKGQAKKQEQRGRDRPRRTEQSGTSTGI